MKQKSFFLVAMLFILLAACDSANQPAEPTATPLSDYLVAPALMANENGLDLVFQGGGAKGLAHIGAIKSLEEQGRSYRRLVGTSAGSIVAVLLAAGYSADEMEAVIAERMPDGNIIMGSFLVPPEKDEFSEEQLRNSVTYRSFQDILPEFVPDFASEELDLDAVKLLLDSPEYRGLFSLLEEGGLYSGSGFVAWLAEQLDRDGRDLGEATLAEFHQATGADLTIVATDTNHGAMLMLNHRTAPDLPVVWAVRMSTSIPFVFQEVEWLSEWGTYQGQDISGHLIVDGGTATNLPLGLVLSQDAEIIAAMEKQPAPERVIGLVLDHQKMLPGLEATPTPRAIVDIDALENQRIEERWQQIEERTLNLVDTLLNAHDNLLAATYPEHVCKLPVGGVETLEYDMSDEKIDKLMAAAGAEMRTCLTRLERR
jgi:NTE family protein